MEILVIMFVVAMIVAAVWSEKLRKSNPEKWNDLKRHQNELGKKAVCAGLKTLIKLLRK